MAFLSVQESVFQSITLNGGGANDSNRAKIPTLTGAVNPRTSTSANVGAVAFTIEFWINATAANLQGAISAGANYNVNGNSILDNDYYRSVSGYNGSWVVSLGAGVPVFSMDSSTGARTITGGGDIRGVGWRHIAVQHNPSTGQMDLYVGGTRVASETGPSIDTSLTTSPSYPNACGPNPSTDSCDFSFPFITVGAEKHDLNPTNFPGAFGDFTDLLSLIHI